MSVHDWAIVLAAGEGSRLRSLTTTSGGVSVPKQFCSLAGGPSLLQETLRRAEIVAPRSRIATVVAEQHRRWWEGPLWSLRASNVVVQPENRGTANGILLPLLFLMERDPLARVVLLPSDHFVRDEAILAHSLRAAMAQLAFRPDEVLLLGIDPDEADAELGYVVPEASETYGVAKVAQFVEKPPLTLARELIGQGGLWNSFIIAAQARALLGLFQRRFPELVADVSIAVRRELRSGGDGYALADLYGRLPELDFSRHVLEGQEAQLRVLRVPQCGWSDLGTPRRVADCLRRMPADEHPSWFALAASAYLNLAAQHARQQMAS